MENNIQELIGLMWKGFSFVSDPKAFFSFTSQILDESAQDLILTFIRNTLDEKMAEEWKLPYEVINCLDDDGFSPFLRYVQYFT